MSFEKPSSWRHQHIPSACSTCYVQILSSSFEQPTTTRACIASANKLNFILNIRIPPLSPVHCPFDLEVSTTRLIMRNILLEVERKFCGLAVPHLIANAGVPCFHKLQFLGEQKFQDTYYDKHDQLSQSGLWVRKRQIAGRGAAWEAKIRKGGDFVNSSFEELTDPPAIAHCVAQMTGHHKSAAYDFGLGVLATLTTQRKTWLADEKFKVVLDSMVDLGHEVGEVELERRVAVPRQQDSSVVCDVELWKRNLTQDMDRQIQEFMQRYHWAFRSGVPKGKLTAYFERRR